MNIQLSDHFTYGRLLRFTLPSIIMMIFTSIYSVVDGLFVSNLVGDMALSAVNIVFPVTMILGAFGFMLGTGGSAIVARTKGEGKKELADRYFSMIICAVLVMGTVLSVLGGVYAGPIARLAGASDALMPDCVAYGRIMLGGSVAFMLQTTFQSFFVVAERPRLGLAFTVASGLTNMVGDYVFIAGLKLGVTGAAMATVLGYLVGGTIPFFLFLSGRLPLRLTATRLYPKELLEACGNGSSELMSNLSSSLVGILYNWRLMAMLGEQGVAAYSVMMYVDFICLATFFGFSIGSAPVISYHHGAANHRELRSIFQKCMVLVLAASGMIVVLSELISRPLSAAFVAYDSELLAMTVHGFRLFALCYLFCGLNVFASSFFTALCNGGISAMLSFSRTLVLRGGMVILLPLALKTDGIWLAVVAAEGIGAAMSLAVLWKKRKQYHYL